MRSSLTHVASAAAFACLAMTAEASLNPFARRDTERSWQPARETAAPLATAQIFNPQLVFHDKMAEADAPVPTKGPSLVDRLMRRHSDDNTCAYVSGVETDSLFCDTTDECIANSINSMVGCCPDTSTNCHIQTTCLASSESDLYTSSDGYTLWCGNSAYPECITHLYEDDFFSGYTLLGCGKIKTTEIVYYTPNVDNSTSTSSTSRSTKSTSSTSKSSTTSSSTTSTTSTNPTNTGGAGGSGSSKSNTGAIVGGVVGGVAGLGIIAAAAFFILRRRNSNKANTPPPAAPAAAASAPPPAPPMMGQQQQPYYPGGPPPPGGPYAGAAAAGYPPQQYQENKPYDPYSPQSAQWPAGAVPSPQPGYGGPINPNDPVGPYNAPPTAPGMGFHSGPVPTTLEVAELPAERGHGELRELA